MSTKTLYRLSGVALLLGSLCAFLFAAIRAIVLEANSPGPVTGPQSPLWQPVNLMIMLGVMFILAGLPGMYARQARQTGWLGFVGFILTFFAVLMFGVTRIALDAFALPFIAVHMPQLIHWAPLVPGADLPALDVFYIVTNLLFCVGTILLGSATIRAHMRPEGAGGLLIFAGILNVVNIVPLLVVLSILPGIAFLIGLAIFGYALVSHREVETARPLLATDEIQSTEAGS